mmetsp:Transcript_63563/g.151608  ORF Transcript_63563/g.151608 Transcript_63563/m.151608 type:complete len:302 (+) Transcript_63563:149-1054(+)
MSSGSSRQRYIPPGFAVQPEPKRDLAAAAMDLLVINPDAVLRPSARGAHTAESADAMKLPATSTAAPRKRGEQSAARKMKERYAALAGAAPPPVEELDLLGLDSSQSNGAPSPLSPPAPSVTRQTPEPSREARPSEPDLLTVEVEAYHTAATEPSDLLFASVAPGEPYPHLYPGEIVLARYGPQGSWYRARVVNSYRSAGRGWADIEWLRPEAEATVGSRQFLCTSGLDETAHRIGLEVGVNVFRPTFAQGAPTPLKAARSSAPSPAAVASPASLQDDLLDLADPSEPLPVLAQQQQRLCQ